MDDKYKQKIKAYNTLRWKGGLTSTTSTKATMAPGNIAFSKELHSNWNSLTKRKYKYLILAIVKQPETWRKPGETIAYLTKRSFDKRIPTLDSNHEYYIEEIVKFQSLAAISLKTKLKDL